MLLVFWLAIRSSGVQTWIVEQVLDNVEERIGNSFEVGSIKVRFPSKIVLSDILIKDQLGDSLLFVPKTQIGIRHYDLKSRSFSLSQINLHQPFAYLQEDPGGGMNIDFLIEALKRDTAKPPLLLNINEINLYEGYFRFHAFNANIQYDKFKPDYIELSYLNVRIDDLFMHQDTLVCELNSLKAIDQCGFEVKELSGRWIRTGAELAGKNISLESDNSAITADLRVDLNSLTPKHLLSNLDIDLTVFNSSTISERDLAHFFPDINGVRKITLVGQADIDEGRLAIKDLALNYRDVVMLRGDVKCSDISTLKQASFDILLDTLCYETTQHQNSLFGKLIDLDTLKFPVNYKSLGTMCFSGTLAGRLQSMETSGKFICDLGQVGGWVRTAQKEGMDSTRIEGELSGFLANADTLLGTDIKAGQVIADAHFSGYYGDVKDFLVKLEMDIPALEWNGYSYKNSNIAGNLSYKFFEGVVNLNDASIQAELDSRIDFRRRIPFFNFELALEQAQLNTLNIQLADSIETLALNMHGSFSGTSLDELEGQIWVTDSYYSNTRGKLPFKQIELKVGPDFSDRQIVLISDYIDARIKGKIYLAELPNQLNALIRKFLPVSFDHAQLESTQLNHFSFNLQLKNPRPFTEIISPELIFKDNTRVTGFFRQGGSEWQVEGFSPQYVIGDKQFTGLTFRAESDLDSIRLNGKLTKLQLNKDTEFDQIQFNTFIIPDKMQLNTSWSDTVGSRNQGNLEVSISFEPGIGRLPRMNMHIAETELFFKDTSWHILPAQMIIDQQFLRIDSLLVEHANEKLLVNGTLSDLPLDTLHVQFEDLNLHHIRSFKPGGRFDLGGIVNGDARIFDLHEKGLFLSDLAVNDFTVNGELLGEPGITSQRPSGSNKILMEVITSRGDISTVNMTGSFDTDTDLIDFDIELEKLRMNVFNAVLEPTFRDIRGIATGLVHVSGHRSDPQFNGEINMQKAGFNLDFLGTRYTFTHPLIVTSNAFMVEDLVARDRFGNEALINGGVKHDKLKNIELDFNLDVEKFLCLETNESSGYSYWGKAFATGFLNISGPTNQIEIDIYARTEAGTDFSVPVSRNRKVKQFDFITYDVDPDLLSYEESHTENGYDVDLSGIQLKFDLEVTPDATVQIIFDAQTGNVITAQGRGDIIIDIDTRGKFSINGDYLIDDGDYLFTLENMPIKQFDVEPGSRINLNGRIGESNLDVVAVYSTKAALYDLVMDESDQDLRQRIPVDCQLNMTGKLEQPGLAFDIALPPSSNDLARSQLSNLTDEEINKQIFSLLILNRFSPLPGLGSASPRSYEAAGISTTTEVLSNQLNYLLSQISTDFDIGFNYRPGDELTSDEVEVAMSTQLLDDRMTINVNGNMDVRQVESNSHANQLVGNVELEYKIIPSGKVRVRAFTRANDRLLYEYSDYTQGMGIFFREEFDRFPDLISKYWRAIFKNDSIR